MTSAPHTADRARSSPTAAYPLVGLAVVVAVIVTLSVVLGRLASQNAYALLAEEGSHLAASIKASTLHGLGRMQVSQGELIRRLRAQADWLDSTLTGDPALDGPLIAQMGERGDADLVAVYDTQLRPLIWTEGPPRRRGGAPGWEAGPFRGPPAMCPDVCGPLAALMRDFYAAGEHERAFDTWRWHHGASRAGSPPIAYARRREKGGVIFLRATPDLTRRMLDVESFQDLLDNLALARKVHSIAVTTQGGEVLFSTQRSQIGAPWRPPPADARLLTVTEPFPLDRDAMGTLRIVLTTEDARAVLRTASRNLAILTVAASLVGVAGLVAVFGVERHHQARVHAMREALHQQERLADLGRMAATVAHEIRNPLNAMGLTAQRLARLPGDGHGAEVAELAGIIRQEVARLDRTVESFLNLARAPSAARTVVSLDQIARSVRSLYESEAHDKGVKLEYDPGEAAVEGDADRLHQAVSNLVRNAIDASGVGKTVRILLAAEEALAVLRVEDEGPGFPPGMLDHTAGAFFTTKTRGMGLGLMLADRVAREHGGSLRIGQRDPGAFAELRIPLARGGAR